MVRRTLRKGLIEILSFSVVGDQALSSTTGEWPTESAMMMILMGARLTCEDRPPLLLSGGAQPSCVHSSQPLLKKMPASNLGLIGQMGCPETTRLDTSLSPLLSAGGWLCHSQQRPLTEMRSASTHWETTRSMNKYSLSRALLAAYIWYHEPRGTGHAAGYQYPFLSLEEMLRGRTL